MLKIKFWRIENVVVVKILEQGEEIERGCNEFFSYNGTLLVSMRMPDIGTNTIYVRGVDRCHDNRCQCLVCDNAEEAKRCIRDYIATVKAYNKSLGDDDTDIEPFWDIEEVIAE